MVLDLKTPVWFTRILMTSAWYLGQEKTGSSKVTNFNQKQLVEKVNW